MINVQRCSEWAGGIRRDVRSEYTENQLESVKKQGVILKRYAVQRPFVRVKFDVSDLIL